MKDKNFDSLDEFYDYVTKSENLHDVFEGQSLEVECPYCNKDIEIKIREDKVCKCPKCGEEFDIDLEVE